MTSVQEQIARWALAAFAAGLLAAGGLSLLGADTAPPNPVRQEPEPVRAARDEVREIGRWEEARQDAIVELAGPDAQAQAASARWRRETTSP